MKLRCTDAYQFLLSPNVQDGFLLAFGSLSYGIKRGKGCLTHLCRRI